VQVEVHHIKAQFCRAHHTEQRVQVRPVTVHQPARLVHQPADLHDVLVEQPERVRVRQHHAGYAARQVAAQVIEIHIPPRVRPEFDDLVAGHGRGGGIGAVCRVGNQHQIPLGIPAPGVIGVDHQHAGELALCAGRRLQRDGRKAADLCQHALQLVHQRQVALYLIVRL